MTKAADGVSRPAAILENRVGKDEHDRCGSCENPQKGACGTRAVHGCAPSSRRANCATEWATLVACALASQRQSQLRKMPLQWLGRCAMRIPEARRSDGHIPESAGRARSVGLHRAAVPQRTCPVPMLPAWHIAHAAKDGRDRLFHTQPCRPIRVCVGLQALAQQAAKMHPP
jgi:hypothetical protein